MKEYRNPLRRSIFIGCASFITLLCLTLGILGFVIYYMGMIDKYHSYINDALKLILTEIDGEDMKECIETGVESEKYYQTHRFMNRMKDNYGFDYIYIVRPLNLNETDNMANVITSLSATEREEAGEEWGLKLNSLTGEDYSADLARRYMDQMDSDEDINYFRNRSDFGYMYTGMMTVRDDSGESVAVLAADLNMDEIMRMLVRYLLILLLEIVVLSALFLTAIFRWMNHRIIQPMTRLERSANGFVAHSHGQTDPDALVLENPDIHTGDELESLSDAILTMSHDMADFMKNLLQVSTEKERIGAELSVATQIQGDMLPNVFPAFPGRKEFDIYASVTPAKEVGGDFYDFFLVDDDHLAIVMADVSDKGIPASLLMVVTKTVIKNQALTGKSPVEVMEEANRQIYENGGGDMFVKAWFAELELSTGVLRSVNAGHDSLAGCPAGGTFRVLEDRKGVALAAMNDTHYEENRFVIKPGGGLFLFTDGLCEAINAQDEFFGIERVLSALNEDPASRPMQTVRRVKKRLGGFIKDAVQYDDITMLSLTFFGPHGADRQKNQLGRLTGGAEGTT